jgi:hypothetical protein
MGYVKLSLREEEGNSLWAAVCEGRILKYPNLVLEAIAYVSVLYFSCSESVLFILLKFEYNNGK